MNPWRDAPVLTGAHMTLRPLLAADRAALVTAASADGLWDLFYASVSQMKDDASFFERAFRDRDAGRSMPFAVLDADGVVCGTTRLLRMNAQHRRVEIGGTFYATRVQRTGVNTEAKLHLLRHAFEALECQCVQIRTDRLNTNSQRAIERLGAHRDGVLRGHQVMADGRLRDSVVYSILEREWPDVRARLEARLARG